MQLLLESQRRRWPSVAVVFSLALHGLVLAAVLYAYHRSPDPADLADTGVIYIAPPDRLVGSEIEAFGQIGAPETAPDPPQPIPKTASPGTGPLVDTEGADPQEVAPEVSMRQELLKGSVLSEIQVDSTVRRDPSSAAPEYPLELLRLGIEGSAYVLFVVDSTGRVDLSSFRVVRATHPLFAAAVQDALPDMKFQPAILRGVPVPQLVEQSFAFKVRAPDTIPPLRSRSQYLFTSLSVGVSTCHASI